MRDRISEGAAGEARDRQSKGVPERAAAAATDWTMKGVQTQIPSHCRTAIVHDFERASAAMSMIALQDRSFRKLSDDRSLEAGFDIGVRPIRDIAGEARTNPRGWSRHLRRVSISACDEAISMA